MNVTNKVAKLFSLGVVYATSIGKPVPPDGMAISPGGLASVIKSAFNTSMAIGAVVAVFYLIMNGINYISSGSDSGKAEKAQKGIQHAIIGLVIILASYTIAQFVFNRLGSSAINDNPF